MVVEDAKVTVVEDVNDVGACGRRGVCDLFITGLLLGFHGMPWQAWSNIYDLCSLAFSIRNSISMEKREQI